MLVRPAIDAGVTGERAIVNDLTTPKIADRILDVMSLISELGSHELIEKTDEVLIPMLNELTRKPESR